MDGMNTVLSLQALLQDNEEGTSGADTDNPAASHASALACDGFSHLSLLVCD